MEVTIDGIRLDAPEGFAHEETMMSWRSPSRKAPDEGLPLQIEVRPNLVAHRRAVEGVDVATLAAGIVEQLARSVDGMSEVRSDALDFADGVRGVLLEYSFAAMQRLRIAQLQAIRLDGTTLTTLTVSTEVTRLTPALRTAYLTCLSSARNS